MTTMAVVKVRGGWAVRFETGKKTEAMTKRAAAAYLAQVTAQRAELAAHEAEQEAAKVALLARHGIGPVDFRQLKPGDLFTWRPEIPPKVVTEAKHFDSGASLIIWERGPYTPQGENCTLVTPKYPVYGRHERRHAHA